MVTVSELLEFIASHVVDPDLEIAVRRAPGGNPQVDVGGTHIVAISVSEEGRLHVDVQ